MVERELPTKFGMGPCSGFLENRGTDDVRTDRWMADGLTMDACAMRVGLLTKSSRAKNGFNFWP